MVPTVLPLIGAADARAADAAAIAAGDRAELLMARAAGHLARTVVAAAGRGAGLRVDLVVGRGDNGGDGWAAAPLLVARGAHVRVLAPDGTDVPTSAASAAARDAWLRRGGTVRTGPVAPHLVGVDGRPWADVVVDCLLGTGAVGPLRGSVGEAAAAIGAARAAGALVVACDVPSGVGADDGRAAEGAVVADVTVTFGALKRGLLLPPGVVHAGRVHLGGIGERFAAAVDVARAGGPDAPGGPDVPGGWWMLTAAGARPRPADPLDEKRRRGAVLVVGGHVGTAGAAALAGSAALVAGAGLVTVAVPEPVRAEVAAMHPALMTVGLPADADGGLHADAVHALPLDGVDAVVVGPGLGTGAGAAAVVAHVRERCPRVVLDADALNVHRDDPDLLGVHPRGAGCALVLTPHARELDRIGGAGASEDRAVRVPELAARWDAHVVAKGPGTMSVAPDGTVHVSPFVEPTLATAGTGDVLAGMLGAALAAHGTGAGRDAGTRGTASEDPRSEDTGSEDVARDVARTVWWHGAAGRIAGTTGGGRTDATGVLAALPAVLERLAATSGRDLPDVGPSGRTLLPRLVDGPLLDRSEIR